MLFLFIVVPHVLCTSPQAWRVTLCVNLQERDIYSHVLLLGPEAPFRFLRTENSVPSCRSPARFCYLGCNIREKLDSKLYFFPVKIILSDCLQMFFLWRLLFKTLRISIRKTKQTDRRELMFSALNLYLTGLISLFCEVVIIVDILHNVSCNSG